MVTPESGNLNDFPAEYNVGKAETAADQPAVFEQAFNLFRCGIGNDIKVFWQFTQHKVADTATHQVRFKTGFIQAVQHFQRVITDVFP